MLVLSGPDSYPFCSHLLSLEKRNDSVRFNVMLSSPNFLVFDPCIKIVYLTKVRDAAWWFVCIPVTSVLIHYSQADGKLPHTPVRSS